MKTRRTLAYQLLIGEVVQQLQRFKPTVPLIKRCVELLIEKEYLERSAESADTLVYIT
jgi:hypothetical protein